MKIRGEQKRSRDRGEEREKGQKEGKEKDRPPVSQFLQLCTLMVSSTILSVHAIMSALVCVCSFITPQSS